MSKFVSFAIRADRDDGTSESFTVSTYRENPALFPGSSESGVFQAETELYNLLVKVFQGEDEE